MTVFAENLRKLRLDKRLTQEQAAEVLGVSAQSVSRWETGVTFPDVMLLPDIARLYGVLVDELFREAPRGYENRALRLLAVFERSGRAEDFLAAAGEFEKLIHTGAATANDWRSYGVMHECMMNQCARKAQEDYDRAMSLSRSAEPEMYYRTQRQKIQLLCRLGQGEACIEAQKSAVRSEPDNPEGWVGLAAAYYHTTRYEDGYRLCQEAMARFPQEAMLYGYGGDFCRALEKYEEAFPLWEEAVRLDARFLDAMYSAALCHEQLAEYEQACRVWTEIAQRLTERGLDVDAQWPAEMAEKCRERMK